MADSREPHLQDPIDRYSRNELTAREARALAQKSLDDPELFEDLTFQAVVKTALSHPSAAQQLQQPQADTVVRFPSRVRNLVVFAGATAAIVLLSLYFLRATLPTNEPSLVRNESSKTVPPTIEPTLAFSAGAGQPVLLSGDLQSELNPRDAAPVFRTLEP